MGTRYRRSSNPGPEPFSDNDTDIDNQVANDRRIRQAISYLSTEGGSDPFPLYQSRVEKINEFILDQFAEGEYTFDQRLYRQLDRLVQDQLNEFQQADEGVSELSGDSQYDSEYDIEEDIEEGDNLGALYRESSAPAGDGTTLEPGLDPDIPEVLKSSKRPGKKSATVVVAKTFLYGGPDNDVERWHPDYPPSLPFGESFRMQDWESSKMSYDLAESAKIAKSKDKDDAIVQTDVPAPPSYAQLRKGAEKLLASEYDSGSRFSLPNVLLPAQWQTLIDTYAQNSLQATIELAVKEFNEGDKENETKKDYAPRIYLQKVVLPENPPFFTPYIATPPKKTDGKDESSGKPLEPSAALTRKLSGASPYGIPSPKVRLGRPPRSTIPLETLLETSKGRGKRAAVNYPDISDRANPHKKAKKVAFEEKAKTTRSGTLYQQH